MTLSHSHDAYTQRFGETIAPSTAFDDAAQQLYAMYAAYMRAGFDAEQALQLLLAQVATTRAD